MAYLRLLAVNVAVLVGILVAIEGVAGYGSFIRGYWLEPDLAERRHTQYDELLGWVNTPWANVPDMYGPGIFLRTNGQGFRNDRNFDRAVPAGRSRVICSGDSYTLGYGVDNDRAWCQTLTTLNPRLETINMGQGGYGVDQAYLWYKRNGAARDHDVHIFAFIADDFSRAAAVAFGNYGNPRLVVKNAELTVTNVPVPGPRNARVRRWLDESRRLRTAGALRRVGELLGVSRPERPDASVAETQVVVARLLADLKRLNQERASTLILVHLPIEDDLRFRDRDDWIGFVEREAATLEIPYISLLDDFATYPAAKISSLFIRQGELDYPGSAGHYSVAGNEFVARLIDEKLTPYLALEQ